MAKILQHGKYLNAEKSVAQDQVECTLLQCQPTKQ